MGAADPSAVEHLLADARRGSRDSLGQLCERYRNYLQLLARTQIDLHLQGRLDPADLVQATFLDACRDFPQFRGTTEAELLAWLRQLLLSNLARQVRTPKRDARRAVSRDQHLAALQTSSAQFEAALTGRSPWVRARVRQDERITQVADRLAQLPADYREVLVLRNLEGLGFAEVARRMGRTTGAVRRLWVQALDQFRHLLEQEELP
jgi:RNA polymerase sigma-70 factor (ECF subfamily)